MDTINACINSIEPLKQCVTTLPALLPTLCCSPFLLRGASQVAALIYYSNKNNLEVTGYTGIGGGYQHPDNYFQYVGYVVRERPLLRKLLLAATGF